MGADRDVTPTLDEVAREGLVFENAIAPAGTTSGSVPTFLTGYYQNPHLVPNGDDYRERSRHHVRARKTLPERFSDRGYETAAITANPWTSRYFEYDGVFDRFEDFMDGDLARTFVENGGAGSILGSSIVNLLNWWQEQDMFMSWEAFYDDVTTVIADASSPYFIWVFLVDAHMPYDPPSSYRTRSRAAVALANLALFLGDGNLPFRSLFHDVLVDTYDDTVRYVDEFVSQLLEDVGTDPLVVVHADHGEAFGEDGRYGHGVGAFGHQFHVPLLVANGPSGTVSQPFSLTRLPRLLLALAAGRPYDAVTDPVAVGRTYHPEFFVRGPSWEYRWLKNDGQLSFVDGNDPPERIRTELATLARDVVANVIASEQERVRIERATKAVAVDERL